MAMEQIGLYEQLSKFTAENAGTAEWCKAERDGKKYFVKKFYSPVYPSKEIGLPEKMYTAGVKEFHSNINRKEELYQRLRECDQSGVLVVPVEVMNYQFHICTIAEYVQGNVNPEQIHLLSEWQRLVLMRTLTLALMNVHKAGIVHSDMKPENVLITQEETGHCKLRLIDFDGSFFEADPPTDPEDVVGDPTFFSPEAYQQSMDEDIRLDHRIDIFALGIIFHYYWTGSYPQKPKNRTIGESLVLNEPVTIDETIPLVLRQLILKMIEKDPEKRITLKSVYDVLGVQIGLYPPQIIKIPAAESKDTKANPAVEDKKRTAEVMINYCDETGRKIGYEIRKIPFGSVKIITAKEIEGYHLAGLRTKEVKVSAKGYVNSPVTFVYRKAINTEKPKKKFRKLVIAFAVLFVLYLIIMYGLAQSAKSDGDYKTAKQYMDRFPLYSELFWNDYHDTMVEINKEEEYSKAISQYRKGNYSDAYTLFNNIEIPYKNTIIYRDFCQAHLKDPADYYSTILNNLGFEDAKTILVSNCDLFCLYMVGTWKYNGNPGIAEMEDDFVVSGLPEMPGGGEYNIKDGVLLYKYEGTNQWKDFYRISVESRKQFTLYAYQSSTSYTLTRSTDY